jgi:hypothetical protein
MVCWKHTLADLSSGVAAPSADLLLVVERPAAGEVVSPCPKNRIAVSNSLPTGWLVSLQVLDQGFVFDLPAASAETVGLGVARSAVSIHHQPAELFIWA